MKQQNTTKLPIELKIYTSHKLPDESLTETQVLKMKAEHCAFMAEGIFCVIERVCKDAAFADRTIAPNPMPEVMQLAIGHLAQIGASLMTACTDYIDEMENSVENAKAVAGGN